MVSIVTNQLAVSEQHSLRLTSQAHTPNLDFSPIPIAWYVDEAFYLIEQQSLLSATKYVGHSLMTPNIGDYFVLPSTHNGKMLIHHEDGIKLSSNICRHRQAVMFRGSGHAEQIVCPLHRWTYQLNGQLLGAPQFTETPCLHLTQRHLQSWQGLLFESHRNVAAELSKIKSAEHFNFADFKYSNMVIEDYDFNWKTFIEVYLEDYHVSPFHPGLNQFVDCNNLHWDFGEHFSAQIVGIRPDLAQSGSSVYQAWQAALTAYAGNRPNDIGAIWLVFYPNLMIEWYPHVLVISHVLPQGAHACRNIVEFYYPEDIVLFEPDFIKAHQAAYFETALEDKEICQRMHHGRLALNDDGKDERGPYQHPLETGLAHFHQWLQKQYLLTESNDLITHTEAFNGHDKAVIS